MHKDTMLKPMPTANRAEFKRWCSIATSCFSTIFICLMVLTVREWRQYTQVQHNIVQLQKQIQGNQQDMEVVSKLQQQIALFSEQKSKLQRMQCTNRPYALLSDISQSMPSRAWVVRVAYDKNTLELCGQAADQAAVFELLKNLQKISFIEKTNLVSLQQQQDQDLFTFSIKSAVIQ